MIFLYCLLSFLVGAIIFGRIAYLCGINEAEAKRLRDIEREYNEEKRTS